MDRQSIFYIKRLYIQNFGPYQKEEILFSVNPKKNITIIRGDQGKGKTMIFQIMWWLLFPERDVKTHEKEMCFLRDKTTMEAVKKNIKPLPDIGNIIDMGGILEIEYIDRSGNNIEFEISRFRKYKVLDIKEQIQGHEIVYEYVKNSDILNINKNSQPMEFIEFYNLMIKKNLPEAVRKFVLIYGEGISNILSMENTRAVKDYALGMSDFPRIKAFEGLLNNYEKRVNDKRRKETKGIKKLENISNEIDELESKKRELEMRKKSFMQSYDELESTLEELNNKKSKIKGKEEFIKKFNKISAEIKILKERKKEIIEERELNLLKYGPLIYMKSAMEECLNDIENKKRKGILPESKLEAEHYKEILRRKDTCLCGKAWDDKTRAAITKLMNKTHKSKVGDQAIIFERELEIYLNEAKDGKLNLQKIEKSFVEVNEQIRKKELDLEEINLGLLPEERKEEWAIKFLAIEDALTKTAIQIGSIENEIGKIDNEIKEMEDLIKEKKSNRQKFEAELDRKPKWGKIGDNAEILREIIENSDVHLVDIIREKTQQVTTSILHELVSDPENWSDISITEYLNGWRIDANCHGVSISNTSRGQTHVLGWSFIFALSSTLGVMLPLVFDSPFVNIDEKTRFQVANNLPRIYEGRQLIFFMKGTEFNGLDDNNNDVDLQESMKEYLGKSYIIENPTNLDAYIKMIL